MTVAYKEVISIQDQIDSTLALNNIFFLEYSVVNSIENIVLHISVDDFNIEMNLWNSENDDREYNENTHQYEDFKPFIRKKVKEACKLFKELKNLLD